MPDKKLTDNEIVKALECCIKSNHFGDCFWNDCPFVSEKGCKVGNESLYPYVLNLINRQKAEIENLTKACENQQKISMDRYFEIERLKEKISVAKVDELIKSCCNDTAKKFAYKLKSFFPSDNEPYQYWEIHEGVDNLLKELVGEDNETKTF